MKSFISALIFLSILEFFILFPEKIVFILPALITILLIGALEKKFYKLSIIILPIFWGLSSFLTLAFSNNPINEQIIAIVASIILYLIFKYDAKDLKESLEKRSGKESFPQKTIQAIILITAFSCYTNLHNAFLEFPYPDWVNSILIFFISLIIAWRFLKTLNRISPKFLLFASIISFIVTQTSWILLYLPFNPLTLSLILTSLLFFLLNISEFHFKNLLSKRLVIRNIFLFIIITTISFMSSPWTP